MERTELKKHAMEIVASGDIQALMMRERPEAICLAARIAVGVNPRDIDIADMDVETRHDVLMIMRGIRNGVYGAADESQAQPEREE